MGKSKSIMEVWTAALEPRDRLVAQRWGSGGAGGRCGTWHGGSSCIAYAEALGGTPYARMQDAMARGKDCGNQGVIDEVCGGACPSVPRIHGTIGRLDTGSHHGAPRAASPRA